AAWRSTRPCRTGTRTTSCGRSTRSIAWTRRSGSTTPRSEARRRSCTAGSRHSLGTAARTDATQDDASLLGGCRVLDLADQSGAVCGRILADLGADVVKVEPPGGEPDRLQPPFVGDVENAERSIPWIAANVNKRSVTCDFGSVDGRARASAVTGRAARRRLRAGSDDDGPPACAGLVGHRARRARAHRPVPAGAKQRRIAVPESVGVR